MKRKLNLTLVILLLWLNNLLAQEKAENSTKITGYVGIVHPIVTFNVNQTTFNFKDNYVVGMPIGINIWKSKTIGFSFEIAPFIKSDDKTSKTNNILIHPGLLIKLNPKITLATRAAFETSGRYGLTSIIGITIKKYESHNFYVSAPIPLRFGNSEPTSIGLGLQVGVAF